MRLDVRHRAVAFLLFCAPLTACTPNAPPHKALEMQPIGTVRNDAAPPPTEGDGGFTTPNSATPAPSNEGPCVGSRFDSVEQALKQCEVPMPKSGEVPSGLHDKLDIQVSTNPSQAKPGGHLEVVVLFRNKTADPLSLYFTGDPTPRFDVEAVDAKGKRVDLPAGKPPKAPPSPGREAKASRLTLSPAGTARVVLSWDAVKTKWAPEKMKTWEGRGFPRASAGPLPAGKYTLRVVLPLLGLFEKGDADLPRVAISVEN